MIDHKKITYIVLGDMLPQLLGGWLPWFADRHIAVVCFGLLFVSCFFHDE